MKTRKVQPILAVFICILMVLGLYTPSKMVSANPSSLYSDPIIIHIPGDGISIHEAFASVSDNGIIEIESGTYLSPSVDGWNIGDLHKQFTVRAAPGANVIFSGGGDRTIIRYQNSNINTVKPVTFENINFADGYSAIEGLAGGLTLYKAKATFVNCTFTSNRSVTQTTSGGAVFITDNSTVFFFNTTWTENKSRVGGAAIGIRQQSAVYIHASQFLNNNNSDLFLSVGGAINLGNSTLRITNSRFDGNRAGLYGGALYIIGNWTSAPYTPPQADVIISNTVFSNNSAIHDQSSVADYPTEGGAINIEDQSLVKVYNSRFINNWSNIAGAINDYRASLEVYGSVFLGNQANDARGTSGFGGAISLNSSDIPQDGTNNRPNATLVLKDSWLQGRYGTTTTSATTGGCLSAGGDNQRLEDDSVPNVGTVDQNRAQVVVDKTVFYDCDTHVSGDGKPASAAVYAALTNLSIQNSVITNSDALSPAPSQNGIGGALTLIYNTIANVSGTTISGNSSSLFGGAIFAQGAHLNLSNSKVFENTIPQLGAAIFSTPDEGRLNNMTGMIENNTFSNNPGQYSIFDDDRDEKNVPYNDLKYNGNAFYQGAQTQVVYFDNKAYGGSATALNSMVVTRTERKVNTDKSPLNNNTDINSAPILGTILAAPSYILQNKAAGEAANPPAMVLYTWSGGNAKYNGAAVTGIGNSSVETGEGTKTLTVGGSTFTTNVTKKANPSATFSVSAGTTPNYTLSWALKSGTFLDAIIDQDANNAHTASGSVNVTAPVTAKYNLYVVTEEGGLLIATDTSAPVLSVPDAITALASLNPPQKKGSLEVGNTGGSILNWTASSQTPALITINTTSGQTAQNQSSRLQFTILPNSPGTYTGSILIESDGGSKQVVIKIIVKYKLDKLFIPIILR